MSKAYLSLEEVRLDPIVGEAVSLIHERGLDPDIRALLTSGKVSLEEIILRIKED
jgi:hypothetical protein